MPPTHPPCEVAQRKEVLFLIDGSESISEANFALIQENINNITLQLYESQPADVSVAFTEYSTAVTQVSSSFHPLSSLAAVSSLELVVNSIEQSFGITNTGDGILAALSFFRNHATAGTARVLVVVTDGTTSASNRDALALAAEQLRAADVTTMAIGIGRGTDIEELKLISGEVGVTDPERAVTTLDFSGLKEIQAQTVAVVQGACTQGLLAV